MAKSTIIFTADDYGAYEEIDDGVIEAIDNGWLNSVAMLANGHDLEKSAEKIKIRQDAGQVDIGCHFTINSGKAISDRMINNKFFTSNGHFQPYFRMNFWQITRPKNAKDNLLALKDELRAQINALTEKGLIVKHLSSHFNTLLFYKEFFQAKCEVLAEPNYQHIKIRSINVKPKISKYLLPLFSWGNSLFAKHLNFEKQSNRETLKNAIDEHWKHQKRFMEAYHLKGNYTPKMPIVLDGFHYQSLGSSRIGSSSKPFKAKRKSKKIKKHYHDYIDDGQIIEFMFHLADAEFMKDTKMSNDKLIQHFEGKYYGVNPKYMDNRAVEFDSLKLFGEKYKNELTPNPWDKL